MIKVLDWREASMFLDKRLIGSLAHRRHPDEVRNSGSHESLLPVSIRMVQSLR